MTDKEKLLLDIVQNDFPISKTPYEYIGKMLNISANECLDMVEKLKDRGIIRRIGGVFVTKKLGYSAVLCVAKVEEEEIEKFSLCVNSFDNVTHNYIRDNHYNIWFTVIAESALRIDEIIEYIKAKTGVNDIYCLPALKTFKINTNFKMR